jgi:hypothetical protein
MARANIPRNGFQFFKPRSMVVGMAEPRPAMIASAYATADIYPGDPVTWLSDGTVARTAAGTTGIYGVVSSVLQYRNSDGVLVRNGRYIPSGTTWTADADRSMVMVQLAAHSLFVVDADDGTSITTIAGARAIVGENADHIYVTPDQGLGLSGALLDISTHAVTATLQWRIADVLEQVGNDPTQIKGRYVVYANVLSNFGGISAVLGV